MAKKVAVEIEERWECGDFKLYSALGFLNLYSKKGMRVISELNELIASGKADPLTGEALWEYIGRELAQQKTR